MSYKKTCEGCSREYEYEGYVNLIVFCPHCHKYDYLECDCGYGPVVPCAIYHGTEEVGVITYCSGTEMQYQLDSKKYSIHIVLKQSYMEALDEARDIIAEHLKAFQG